ncbi:MAG TPA: YdeI/OmpD-associated family protein [Candidatus Saccharimonadales bacterium]|nr:YdeI/OmpD-associated family protein [Candidatus Saccharimonadales bacterium]
MSAIKFESKLFKIGKWTILRLPKSESIKLPSRSMTMVKGTINGIPFKFPLEPDGAGSHWFEFNKAIQQATGKKEGNTVKLSIEPTKEWTEPEVPDDLKKALSKVPKANSLWKNITPNARWDWIRWIRITKQLDTRKRRIEIACSKLKSGMRRPCCFNRNLCSETYVSKNGLLMDPTQKKK